MDVLLDLWQYELVAGIHVRHVVEVVLVFLVFRALYRHFFPRGSIIASTTGRARCQCGWKGLASLHSPRCPRCGKHAYLE